jgi:hypothetical protein
VLQGSGTSRLGDYPQGLPKSQLGALDCVVGNHDYGVHMPLGDGIHERADATRRERICCDPTSRCIDRSSSLDRHRERWGAFRFDANDLDLTAEPRRNSGN